MGFKEWFYENGNQLLRSWLRAKEDGNTEPFSDWVIAEYDFYTERQEEGYEYEVPYHGICDNPAIIELLIFQDVRG